jgi:predicted TIM-barrel fold metal-dependent hydrolase
LSEERYMEDYEIIDAHIHMARTSEEARGWWAMSGRRGRDRWGTPEGSIPFMERNGISKMVVLVIPPRLMRPSLDEKARIAGLPMEQRLEAEKGMNQKFGPIISELNEWVCTMNRSFPRLVPFVLLAKELGGVEGMIEELEQRIKQGAKGVKLHPGMFCLLPYDSALMPVYERCQELGLPVVSDSGPWAAPRVLAGYPTPSHERRIDYGEPDKFSAVLEEFPRLTLVLAHLGSAQWDERVELAQRYPNLCFDISQGFSSSDRIPRHPHRGLGEEDAVRIMRKIGVERIMFGTDGPSGPFHPQLEQFLRLPLSDEERRMILSENAKRILHI